MHWKNIAMLSAMLTAVLFAGLFMGPAYRWGEIELKRRPRRPTRWSLPRTKLAPS